MLKIINDKKVDIKLSKSIPNNSFYQYNFYGTIESLSTILLTKFLNTIDKDLMQDINIKNFNDCLYLIEALNITALTEDKRQYCDFIFEKIKLVDIVDYNFLDKKKEFIIEKEIILETVINNNSEMFINRIVINDFRKSFVLKYNSFLRAIIMTEKQKTLFEYMFKRLFSVLTNNGKFLLK